MDFSNYLKNKRVEAHLSQSEVATQLGYTTSQFVSNWERGISQPPIQSLLSIAVLYKISVDEMFEVYIRSTLKRQEGDLRIKFEEVKKELKF